MNSFTLIREHFYLFSEIYYSDSNQILKIMLNGCRRPVLLKLLALLNQHFLVLMFFRFFTFQVYRYIVTNGR